MLSDKCADGGVPVLTFGFKWQGLCRWFAYHLLLTVKYYGYISGRSIPGSRDGLSKVLASLQLSSSTLLPLRSFGLSLSDQYWLKPAAAAVTWEQINFFTNSFSEDIGAAFFNPSAQKLNIDFMSPDNTSDGWLKKKWLIMEGKRCLIKTGSGPYFQEPFNEAVASLLVQNLQRFNFSALEGAAGEVAALLQKNVYLSQERRSKICQALIERIEVLKLYQRDAAHVEKAAFFKQLQLNTEPIFVYYRDLAGAEAERKYNPELDKKILHLLLQDGFSLVQCQKILLHSPNLKNARMVDLLIKNS